MLARTENNVLTICEGYACDGYTPSFLLLGKRVRLVPTPSCGVFPAVLHDLMRQFVGVPVFPWGRRRSDEWFYDAMVVGGSTRAASIYYGAVSGVLGDVFTSLFKEHDPNLHVTRA